ncbi:MAG: hypothetical protein RL330_758 [Actinomycetota bacterium]
MLGLGHVTASGVAVIIGAGIYVLLGPAAQDAGGLVWLSFVVAAVLCALTAFSYMELSSMYPKAGSEHEFTRHAFPPVVSFSAGWAMTTGLIVASASVALGFARYMGEFVDLGDRTTAWVVILAMALISATGMAKAAWVVIAMGSVEIGSLVVVAIVGLPDIGRHSLVEGGSITGVAAAAGLIFFAFIGFDEVITLAEETRDPVRNVPRALFLALVISTFLYVAVAAVSVGVLGADELARAERPLASVMEAAVGGRWRSPMAIAALLSTASTVLLLLTASSRMIYGMASAGALPRALARVEGRRVPGPALVLVTVSASVLVLLEDFSLLAAATDALVYFIFVLVNLTVIVLRFRLPDHPRPYRVRGTVRGVAVVPVLGIIVTLAVAARLDADSGVLALGILAAGVAVWLALRGPRDDGAS